MSTNYYLPTDAEDPEEGLHVGKSSIGWRFLFRSHTGLETVDSVRALLNRHERVVDEYGREVSLERFWALVEMKQELRPHLAVLRTYGYLTEDGYEFCTNEFS
jgi:hypothetical protein